MKKIKINLENIVNIIILLVSLIFIFNIAKHFSVDFTPTKLLENKIALLSQRYSNYFNSFDCNQDNFYLYQKNIDKLYDAGLLKEIKVTSVEIILYPNRTTYQINYQIIKNEFESKNAFIELPLKHIILIQPKNDKSVMNIVFKSDLLQEKLKTINQSEIIKKYSTKIYIYFPIKKVSVKNLTSSQKTPYGSFLLTINISLVIITL